MKKSTGRKTISLAKKRPSKGMGTRRKATSTATLTKRKKKPATTAVATKAKVVAKKIMRKSSRDLAVRPIASDKALQMGRAVGTILGKAIGNVERAVSRAIKSSKAVIKK